VSRLYDVLAALIAASHARYWTSANVHGFPG